tara:strand:- start:417 stop:866 length:450 start_codon:yes stop_codon:yes gene_type:complete
LSSALTANLNSSKYIEIEIANNKTPRRKTGIKYISEKKIKKIEIRFIKKLKSAKVCIIVFSNNRLLKISIWAKYRFVVSLFLVTSLSIKSSWSFLIRVARELYLFPKLIIISGIAGNNMAGSKTKLFISLLSINLNLFIKESSRTKRSV